MCIRDSSAHNATLKGLGRLAALYCMHSPFSRSESIETEKYTLRHILTIPTKTKTTPLSLTYHFVRFWYQVFPSKRYVIQLWLPPIRASYDGDFIKWVWLFYWVLALKIFVSTQNLRNTVPLFHLLVAIDNYYTLYKFGFRKPNRWGPRGEKPILGYFGAPNGRFSWLFTWDPNISVFGLQIGIACSSCQ